MTLTTSSARVDNIRRSMVNPKMPRALEMLDTTLRRKRCADHTSVA